MDALILATLITLAHPGSQPHSAGPAANVAPTTRATATLSVTVTGIRSEAGAVEVIVFATPAGFPTNPERALARRRVPVRSGQAVAEFPGLELGPYAVAVYHDENGNGRMDTKLFGIPKEGTGASNDARGRLGPPSYQAARFDVSANRGVTIRMTY
jgi:uncharacterized protein (DUF2141 family)